MILLVDGRSGSGKTEFATALRELTGAQLVRMDSLYPGWGGLEAGSRAVTSLLGDGRWHEWDWGRSEYAGWHEVDLSKPLIVEGCGALSRANRALADRAVWVSLDDATRRRRALDRDGDVYAPHWDRWAAQEWDFIVRELPISLADEVIDGRDAVGAATREGTRWRALLDPARVDE